jgi:hypothetical protein
MVKMRIPIREQLGCLVLLASTIGLAVIAIATWITNHSFVLGIRWDFRGWNLPRFADTYTEQLASR